MIPLLSTIILTASWYGDYFHGRTAANGSIYNMNASTAAHKTLPFGTKLEVCYEGCEVVTITDRGPFIPGRHLDLSKGTARRIGMLNTGVAPVTVKRLN
ncbi:MAG: septal ring lytic transglycosylase RlpA family lipoprotein [Chloroflexi bacterium]|nr:septal ring lytic transglycosylase RlpA family lipoprotein [Chloroflexota bacterium]|tara:strand:- start:87 stop:383 length:297 start_codon:yes stop_codon:yes gene_type:complete